MAVMLGNRVLGAECDRFGIRVAEGEIDRWWKEHLADLERRARLELGVDGTVEGLAGVRLRPEPR
ncbi:MAG: hypothetical protein R3F20_10320 [Planctomycetota bacterium]